MVQMVLNSLAAVQIPAQQWAHIGLRASAGVADAGCLRLDQLCALQLSTLRSAMNNGGRAINRIVEGESGTLFDPALAGMRETADYWRSLSGLLMSMQADTAAVAESGLRELSETLDASTARLGDMGPVGASVCAWNAVGASALASLTAICEQIGRGARRLAADSVAESEAVDDAARVDAESKEHRARVQRKAA